MGTWNKSAIERNEQSRLIDESEAGAVPRGRGIGSPRATGASATGDELSRRDNIPVAWSVCGGYDQKDRKAELELARRVSADLEALGGSQINPSGADFQNKLRTMRARQ